MTELPTRRVAHPGTRVRRSRPVIVEDAQLAGRAPIASFARYADAERTVDLLAAARFPVGRLALVGSDLKLVEQVTRRLTAVRAGCWGAGCGAWLAVFMTVLTLVEGKAAIGALLASLPWGALLGAAFGASLSVTAYAVFGHPRDFSSRRRLAAARYELYVDGDIAASAWPLLLKLHPAGMTLVDRAPAEVIAVPAELALIEMFEPVDQPVAPPPGPEGAPREPLQAQADAA